MMIWEIDGTKDKKESAKAMMMKVWKGTSSSLEKNHGPAILDHTAIEWTSESRYGRVCPISSPSLPSIKQWRWWFGRSNSTWLVTSERETERKETIISGVSSPSKVFIFFLPKLYCIKLWDRERNTIYVQVGIQDVDEETKFWSEEECYILLSHPQQLVSSLHFIQSLIPSLCSYPLSLFYSYV